MMSEEEIRELKKRGYTVPESPYTFWNEPDGNEGERFATVIDHTPAAAILLDDEKMVYFLEMEEPRILPVGTWESVDGIEPICTLDELNACITEMEVGKYAKENV